MSDKYLGYDRDQLRSILSERDGEIERLTSVADAEMKLREGNFAEIERLREDYAEISVAAEADHREILRLRDQLRRSCDEARSDPEMTACPLGYEVTRLRAALMCALGYAQHEPGCSLKLSVASEEGTCAVLASCDCGLDEVLDVWREYGSSLTSE